MSSLMNSTPLAERLRPKTLADFINQTHLVGPDGPIYQMLKKNALGSFILWGPPGTGKTTLAEIISKKLDRPFYKLSAVSSGVKDIREVIERAKKKNLFQTAQSPILFIDEIHRFNKNQQDALLEAVEKGWITLIGATTENPSFEVISALLSRCQVYTLNHLSKEDLKGLIQKALTSDKQLNKIEVQLEESEALLNYASGDARKLLNALELVVRHCEKEKKAVITNQKCIEALQQNTVLYDKNGEMHYDIISAFIKSIRGSDPDGAVYWLARMITGGEEVKFIARRLIILASEDIGNANPTALVLANTTFEAVNKIGYPEARIILSQCVVYLANSPKSNASYLAINKAMETVNKTGNLAVPFHLRNAPTQLMKNRGYGKEYKYSHNGKNNYLEQNYLPTALETTHFYQAGNNTREQQEAKQLRKRKET